MSRVLIAGASRGIGLELAKQYADLGNEVIACVRDTAAAALLDALAEGRDNLSIEQMDLGDPVSIESAGARIGGAIDVLIVVAGVFGGMQQSLDDINVEEWHKALDVNTIGPMLTAKAFRQQLGDSGDGKFLILTSQLAASTWPMGGMYIYSTTKAAVSKVGQILALDWAGEPISVALIHPGYVQTDMGGPNAEITAEESASGIRDVAAKLGNTDSGAFYKWNGEVHPW
jgi:NAD(P)-dependent dehydrogenase (short-subunit alcohol dehydrogenase family)